MLYILMVPNIDKAIATATSFPPHGINLVITSLAMVLLVAMDSNGNNRMYAILTVSYTHLDVYKRQMPITEVR